MGPMKPHAILKEIDMAVKKNETEPIEAVTEDIAPVEETAPVEGNTEEATTPAA